MWCRSEALRLEQEGDCDVNYREVRGRIRKMRDISVQHDIEKKKRCGLCAFIAQDRV